MSVRATVTAQPIGAAALLAEVAAHDCGAATLFVGTVRDSNAGRRVSGMRYEAYERMAAQMLERIAGEAAARVESGRGPLRIAVEHRSGELSVGEASVAIAVAAPHREEAFAACRYIIEEIKRRLPVWKEEHYTSGDAEWLGGQVPPAGGSSDRSGRSTGRE